MNRIERERATVEAMVRLYCAGHHKTTGGCLCPDCKELLGYAMERLGACAFAERKPVCAACSVHCYRADQRERIRSLMRWAGPRMIFRHPFLALLHLADRMRPSGGKEGPRNRADRVNKF